MTLKTLGVISVSFLLFQFGLFAQQSDSPANMAEVVKVQGQDVASADALVGDAVADAQVFAETTAMGEQNDQSKAEIVPEDEAVQDNGESDASSDEDCPLDDDLLLAADLDVEGEVVDEEYHRPEMFAGTDELSDLSRMTALSVLILVLIIGTILFHKRVPRLYQLILFVASLIYFGFIRHGCVCPIGSIGSVAVALGNSGITLGIVALLFFLIPLLFAFFFGRIFCGSACPMGAIQELLSAWSIKVPSWIDKPLKMCRHYILAAAVVMGASSLCGLPICKLDPFVTLFRLSGTLSAWIWLAVALLISIFIARPFCRWFCPYGLLLGFFARFSFKKRQIVAEDCIRCRKCVKVCPVACIKLPEIDSFSCVTCGRCSNVCPKDAIK